MYCIDYTIRLNMNKIKVLIDIDDKFDYILKRNKYPTHLIFNLFHHFSSAMCISFVKLCMITGQIETSFLSTVF